MQLQGTRTFLEPRVGQHHSVEVILHVRRVDLEWFNAKADEHLQELLFLLTDQMVPRMCHDEIEQYFQKRNPQRFPKSRDDKIGERNTTKSKAKKGAKRKRGKSNPPIVVVGQEQEEDDTTARGKEKDVYYAFGENLYVAYKAEELNVYSSVTLTFKNTSDSNDNDNNKPKGKTKDKGDPKIGTGDFTQLTKLSKRFILWCFKTDPENPRAPDPPDAGYLEPETISLSNLFRSPPEEEDKKPKAKARATKKGRKKK